MDQSRSYWPAVIAYAFAASAAMGLQLTFAPITTVAAEHWQVSVEAIGWLAQVFTLLYVVLALPMGVALDRWFRGSLMAGAILTAAGATLRLVDDRFEWVLAGQVVAAVAQPLLLNGVTKVASDYLNERDRPKGIAACMASMYAGQVLAIGIATAFSRPEQVHLVTSITSLFAIVSMSALLLVLRRAGQFGAVSAAPGGLRLVREIWRDPFMRAMAGLAFVSFGVVSAYLTWLEALLAPAGITASASGVMLLAFMLGGIVGAALLPPWSARRGLEFTLLLAALIASAVVSAVLAGVPTLAAGMVGVPLIGILQLSALPVMMEMTERRVGRAAGTATALVWMAGNAGGTAISIAVQSMIGRPGSAFLLLAAIALVCTPLVHVMRSAPRAGTRLA